MTKNGHSTEVDPLTRRWVAALVFLATVLTATPALAGFGLAEWREQWAEKHPAPTLEVGVEELSLATADELAEFHRAYRAWEHRAWVAWAEHRDAVERAAERLPEPSTAQSEAPTPSGSCYSIISAAFGSRGLSVSYAYSIALRESNCNPDAWNPIELNLGHASGLFQIVAPGIWEMWDGPCGYEMSSVFNAVANANVAACMVASGGWGPWGG